LRYVPFRPDKLTGAQKAWWDAWKIRALNATKEAIRAWEEDGVNLPRRGFRDQVWADLKQWLLSEFFRDKCAYCQVEFTRSFAAAEHFRPKGQVQILDLNGDPVDVFLPEAPKGHPGYFWLAYSWENLVPACTSCNSGEGKNAIFPVDRRHCVLPVKMPAKPDDADQAAYESRTQPGHYYLRPPEIDELERPLLLNPMFDNPREYIRFKPKGFIYSEYQRGKESIKIYRLDEDKLRGRRQTQEEFLRRKYYGARCEAETPEERDQAIRRVLAPFIEGRAEYSEAALQVLEVLEGRDLRALYGAV
jgi:hypothetical protein